MVPCFLRRPFVFPATSPRSNTAFYTGSTVWDQGSCSSNWSYCNRSIPHRIRSCVSCRWQSHPDPDDFCILS